MAAAFLIGVSACTANPFEFEYEFNIDGHANGDVNVTFPGGDLTLKGDAELGFDYSSAPELRESTRAFKPVTVEDLQSSKRVNYKHVADVYLSDYDAAFTASAAEGTYYLHITGAVKEKLTGVEVKIDKVLTNEESLNETPDYKSE